MKKGDEIRCPECGCIYVVKHYNKDYIFCHVCHEVIYVFTE